MSAGHDYFPNEYSQIHMLVLIGTLTKQLCFVQYLLANTDYFTWNTNRADNNQGQSKPDKWAYLSSFQGQSVRCGCERWLVTVAAQMRFW